MKASIVRTYPLAPGAVPSSIHAVRVESTPLPVERYAGIGYVRFAMKASVRVEIEVEQPIADHTIFPAERASSVRVSGNVLALELPEPRPVVIWIDRLEKLFVLPDPPEDESDFGAGPSVFDVTDFGADPNGLEKATDPIQAAIDRAARLADGGTVLVPPGRFLSGTLELRSRVRLHLAAGAILQGSPDPRDYPVDPGRQETAADESLPPDVRFLGRTMTFSRMLLVDRAERVTLDGHGTIDGAGTHLRSLGAAPNLLRIRRSRDVRVRDLMFRDSAAWSLHILASDHLAIDNVKIVNDRANLNTDGVDVDMSSYVTVERSFIYTKDDAICVKATGNGGLTGEPRHIVASGNLVSSMDAALKVGTESEAATFGDILFDDNAVFDSGRAMSVVVRDGATYDGIAFRRILVGPHVDHLVEQVIGVRDPASSLGAIRNLTFDDILAPSYEMPPSDWTWYAQFRPGRPGPDEEVDVFEGADADHSVVGLVIRGLQVNGRTIRDAADARNLAGLTIGPHVRDVRFG